MVLGYGQVGDGNLHIRVLAKGWDNHELQQRLHYLIDPFVVDYVVKAKGSI